MMRNIFIVVVRYIVEIAQVDARRAEHILFLESQYKNGTFISSGPQVPRHGGIIMAIVDSRSILEEILTRDPYAIHHLAEYQIYEFSPMRYAPEFRMVVEKRITGNTNQHATILNAKKL